MATFSLSGSGVQALSAGVTAVHVTITTLPIAPSGGSANPTNYYHVGMLRFGDAVGYFDAIPIVGGPQWLAVPSGTTRCGYSLSGGSVISLVEVIGGTPPFGGAGALSTLSDVALTSPADTQLLTYQASSGKWINANAPSGGGGISISQLLNYVLASDVSFTTTVNTWVDVIANQSFTVTKSTAHVFINVIGFASFGNLGGNAVCASRLVLDSAGANLVQQVGLGWKATTAFTNPFGGNASFDVGPQSVGTHTVKVQIYCNQAETLTCRPISQPNLEGLRIQITQLG